jgi:hypothetical protein
MTKIGLFLPFVVPVVFAPLVISGNVCKPAVAQDKYATRAVLAPTFPANTTVKIAPPADPGPQFEPAPMPDADLYPPVAHVDNPQAAQLTPSLFQPKNQYRGDGFSPGSTVQGNQERLLKPTPGLSMKVPLN